MSESQDLSVVSHITVDDDVRPSLPVAGRFPELKGTEQSGASFALPPLAAPRPVLARMPLPWPVLAGGGLVAFFALGVMSIYSLQERRTDSPTVSRDLTPWQGDAPLLRAESEPVRFTNPFDRGEVFEFPAGTSRTQARDQVAELLKARAAERSAAGLVPKVLQARRKLSVDRGRVQTPQG